MFIRIEPSSAVPIYRQIMDQIKYQIAIGALKGGDRMPSVRQLAEELLVNQNTVLKVYNQLTAEKVLVVERGSGTFVAEGKQSLTAGARKNSVAGALREAAVKAVHLEISLDQMISLLEKEYADIVRKKKERGE